MVLLYQWRDERSEIQKDKIFNENLIVQ